MEKKKRAKKNKRTFTKAAVCVAAFIMVMTNGIFHQVEWDKTAKETENVKSTIEENVVCRCC